MLIEVMKCVDLIGRREFTLADVYASEDRLSRLYPGNQQRPPQKSASSSRCCGIRAISNLSDAAPIG